MQPTRAILEPARLARRPPRVAVVSLGRAKGMGEARRVASWIAIFEAAGAEASVISLIGDHRARVPSGMSDVVTGTAVPETLAWSKASVTRAQARSS